VTLRLGYFPNVTHATAIVGVEKGFFADALGSNVKLETATYNSGTDAGEALFNGAIDATFIGPNPAINAFAKSHGEAVRIVSGATSGGAALVVSKDITEPSQLKGKTLSTPSLGNTQDVALRTWLADQGLKTDTQGGGDVSIAPQENADTLTAFQQGQIDGAWVPEPWATRLVQEGGGHVLVDERDLWPGGRFVTAHLLVSTKFLEKHPDVIKSLLEGLVKSTDWVNQNPDEAKTVTNDGIEKITGKALKPAIIDAAWKNLTFTLDPIASSLQKSAKDAEKVGLLEPVDLHGIYDLTLLNQVLRAQGKPTVSGF
jgi:NitT/TauT family transport system substrate-binding protein